MNIRGILCSPRRYEYKGIVIEDTWAGMCPLRKDGEPRLRWTKDMAEVVKELGNMPSDEREKYRVGGGCREF